MVDVPFVDRMTHDRLDRANARRHDTHWIAQRLACDRSLFVPLWRGKVLLRQSDSLAAGAPEPPRAVFLSGDAAHRFRLQGGPWAFLGLLEDTALFVVDGSEVDDPIPLLPQSLGEFAELRPLMGLLPAGEAALLGHARALMHWRGRHRFCGLCGGACEAEQAGNVLRCTNCATQHFPRTDTAVIMLVSRDGEAGGAQVLLAHSPRFPTPRLYTVLAGFVEPGENLEQAVAREVMEETGISVHRVRYFGSQAWPFPGSIMLGFTAEATNSEITIDTRELADARWFPKAAIRDPAAFGIDLPHPVTIARQLLETWAREGKAEASCGSRICVTPLDPAKRKGPWNP
jgi:NAD+ diphosphatase